MRRLHVVVGALAVCGLALAACGDDSGDDAAPAATVAATPTSAASTATTAASTAGTDSQGYPTGSASATVSVVKDPKLGDILVGPDGRTLYLFTADNGTTTACTGGCAAAWPALAASGTPTAGDGVDGSKLQVVNAQVPNQVVYNGHLLYYFAKDTKPGDTLGTAIPKWYAVSPEGDEVEAG